MRKTFAVIALLGMLLVWLSGRADASTHRADHPITICHYDGSDDHGGSGKYSVITVDTSSTRFAGHEGHVHDIIPPTSDDGTISVAPKNWDAAGQAIWRNGCQATSTTTTSTVAPTTTVEPPTTTTEASTSTSTTLPETSTSVEPTTSTTSLPSTTSTTEPSSTTSTLATTTSTTTGSSSTTVPGTTVSSSPSPTTGPSTTLAPPSGAKPTVPGATPETIGPPAAPPAELAFTGGWQQALAVAGALLFSCGVLCLVAFGGRRRS